MRVRGELVSKIEQLPEESLIKLSKYVDELTENNRIEISRKCATGKQLEKLKNKPNIESHDTLDLAKNLRKDWDIVKQYQLLTFFVIDVFREFVNPQSEAFATKRINGDSRTGGFFEDKFCFLLTSYLRSKPVLLTHENKFEKIKIALNDSIAVPGERTKRKPDILIEDYETGEPICIIELKASFTKRSLVKTYNSDYEMWKQLNENIKFLFVILRSNSENKSNTYRKVNGCRVICYDLKTDKDSKTKGIKPKIVTPIEDVFDEVYQAILDFESRK